MSVKKAVKNQPGITADPQEPHSLLKIWYKIYETETKFCILYVYEWDNSTVGAFPTGHFDHDWDYEPIIYCYDKQTGIVTWIYDSGHYDADNTTKTNNFKVAKGSHYYIPDTSGTQGAKSPASEFQELDLDTLMEWERKLIGLFRGGMGQLSLWEAFLDPCKVKDTDAFGVADEGEITRTTKKYELSVMWYYSDIGLNHWEFSYFLHNLADSPITSFKLCFDSPPSVDDIEITYTDENGDQQSKRWTYRVEGNCIIIELAEGFANSYGIKKCKSLIVQITSNAWDDKGTADAAVDRGNNNTYDEDEENTTVPGPVASLAPKKSSDWLAAVRREPLAVFLGRKGMKYFDRIKKPGQAFDAALFFNKDIKFKSYKEMANVPLEAIDGIGPKRAAMLAELFGIKTVKELRKIASHPWIKAGKVIRNLAEVETINASLVPPLENKEAKLELPAQ
jgi:hypothetical protein